MSVDTNRLLDVYIKAYYEALDCPRSLTCWLLYCSKEHKALASLEWNPEDYNDLEDARDSLSATSFLSKSTFLETGNDLKEEALKKFYAAEEQCKKFNKRIQSSLFNNAETLRVIFIARSKIEDILGDFEPEELVDACNWGPGATTSIPRRDATAPNKFETESLITAEAYDFIRPWFNLAYPSWVVDFKPGAGSKIVTVPKNAKTDRTIAIEPGINLWFQKGIGALIRRRLLRTGINLNDQSFNQKISRVASKFNDIATVDFSSASDTICRAVVEELLPARWFILLDTFRSKFGRVDNGDPIFFEKFSSMGNGFTFELESLIFYAVAFACECIANNGRIRPSVYGDDVTISTASFMLFRDSVEDLGFTINTRKSYFSTYYRESCGSHYWNGINIKPIFQKEPLNETVAIIKSANNVRRLAQSRCILGCDRRLRRCWQILTSKLTHVSRISEGYGDVGVIENLETVFRLKGLHASALPIRMKHGIEGHSVRVYALLAAQRELDGEGLRLFKLKSISNRLEIGELGTQGNQIALPIRTRLTRIRLHVPQWYDLGPWV